MKKCLKILILCGIFFVLFVIINDTVYASTLWYNGDYQGNYAGLANRSNMFRGPIGDNYIF